MKLNNFKKFTLKKKGDAADDAAVEIESTTAEQIAEMEKKLTGRKKDLEETADLLNGLAAGEEEGTAEDPVGPHPPLEELTLDDIDLDDDDDFDLETPAPDDNPVQVVSLKPEEAPAGPVESVKVEEIGEEDEAEVDEAEAPAADDAAPATDDDMSNLFSQEEEEENPLANLINFLPDVTVQELIDDIDEIKGIIKEWQQS